jgi:hypothetical protein
MSNDMLNQVFGLRVRLRPAERLVFLALADRCNGAGVCDPGIKDTARRTGLTPRGVEKVLRDLERRRLVVTRQRSGRTSVYRLTPERPFGGAGQASNASTPERRCTDPRTAVHPNPTETPEYPQTVGSSTDRGGGASKLAARRRRR